MKDFEMKAGVIMQYCLMIGIMAIWGIEFYFTKTSNNFVLGVLTGVFVGVGGFQPVKEIDDKKEQCYNKVCS